MSNFFIKKNIGADVNKELESIGFDKSYISHACEKYNYVNLKIFSLTVAQASILKQTALAFGADCAIHKDVVTAKINLSDCILGGSISQIKKIATKLKQQPFKLALLSENILDTLEQKKIKAPKVVGILNLTYDSFSDGGEYIDFEAAKRHLQNMIKDGAEVIDIGAESTKPFAKAVSDDIQLKFLIPMLEYIKNEKINVEISVDTRSAVVAKKCIELGVDIINDVSGMDFDKNMINVISDSDVKIIIQHSLGTPENMQISPEYDSVMDEIFVHLKDKIDFAIERGIEKSRIIVDPGIGFGKKREHNFEIIRRLEELKTLCCPIMLGVSRKSLLNMQEETNEIKDIFTVALNTLAIENGVDYLRVHNVALNKKLVLLMENYKK